MDAVFVDGNDTASTSSATISGPVRPSRVLLSSAVDFVCRAHADGSEMEEIAGLLVGYIDQDTLVVADCIPMLRVDRRRDRVEMSPEQLAAGVEETERLKAQVWPKEMGTDPQLVGWYHSHPHITVLPSEVDICTQTSQEQFSSSFVGLIFSVFSRNERRCSDTLQLIAFQSNPSYDDDVAVAFADNDSEDSQLAAVGELRKFTTLPVEIYKERNLPLLTSVRARLAGLSSLTMQEATSSLLKRHQLLSPGSPMKNGSPPNQVADNLVTAMDMHNYYSFTASHCMSGVKPLVALFSRDDRQIRRQFCRSEHASNSTVNRYNTAHNNSVVVNANKGTNRNSGNNNDNNNNNNNNASSRFQSRKETGAKLATTRAPHPRNVKQNNHS